MGPESKTISSNLITICPNFSHFLTLRGAKKILLFEDITRAQKKPPILYYQTLFVKPYINACYNLYMGRNYFSKHGGPYFINDGFTRHADKPYVKPDKGFFYFIAIGFVIALGIIGSFLFFL